MLPRRRRFLAYLLYLRRPFRNFLPVASLLLASLAFGAVAFHLLYEQQSLSLSRAFFITYSLIFNEHLLPYPHHWLLQTFYWIMPPLGLVAVLDGIVQVSYYVLRRDGESADWNQAMAKTLNNHVVLVGLGKVGLRTLQTLLDLGEPVAVLEKDESNPNLAFARQHGVPTLIGGGRQAGILSELNVEKARSIILATDDDLVNLELAMDARKLRPGIRVVLRMFDQELAGKIKESFDIQVAFSTSALAAPLFATASADRSIDNAFRIGERLVVVASIDVRPESDLIGMDVAALRKDDVLVLGFESRGRDAEFNPPSGTKLAVGDRITVQCEPKKLRAIHEMNKDPEPY